VNGGSTAIRSRISAASASGHSAPSRSAIVAQISFPSATSSRNAGSSVAESMRYADCIRSGAMIDLVASRKSEIEAICRQHGVQAMWLFGSAAKGTWDATTSDLDFLVDLGNHDVRYAKRLMRTIVELERLFGVQVDVTTTEQVTSDWFRQELDASKEMLFEAERASVAG
jgi:uncharacterized protein